MQYSTTKMIQKVSSGEGKHQTIALWTLLALGKQSTQESRISRATEAIQRLSEKPDDPGQNGALNEPITRR